ncbi:hypothetical protein [Aquisphaera insulae]|uniref:hypothetical protein n=1 Tax=Aquisphaera insulae TaxID=2712864 RepID=UPI0013EA848A|nr:hypothetical protein [Aquisphaera insulae]
MSLPRFLTATILLLIPAGPARANMLYQIADASGTPAEGFRMQAGESLDVRIYVVGTDADAAPLNDVGLLAAGVDLRFLGEDGAAVELTKITFGPGFLPPPPDPVIDTPNGRASLSLLADPLSPVLGTNARILLGTFTFHALAPGIVDLVATSPDDGFDAFLLGDASRSFNIGPRATADIQIRHSDVGAIPEPRSLLLLAIGGMAPLLRGSRYNPHRRGGPRGRRSRHDGSPRHAHDRGAQ